MPQLEYFLVAESVATDSDRNTVSVFHILEELRASSMPFHVGRLVALSSWNIGPQDRDNDFQVTLDIHLPGGDKLPDGLDLAINFTATRSRQRILHFIEGLRIASPGDLAFELLINGKHAASHRVTVHPPEPSG